MEFHKQHLSISDELGDRAVEALAYGSLGIIYRSLSSFKQAIECHTKQPSIAKEVRDRRDEAETYGNLGIAYSCIGE